MPKLYTPVTAAADLEKALRLLEGRWKLVILFHLFGGKIMRFSDLERAISAITQKMLGQQLKAMDADGIVFRTIRLTSNEVCAPWGPEVRISHCAPQEACVPASDILVPSPVSHRNWRETLRVPDWREIKEPSRNRAES